jgi:hypothetical protein
MGAGSGLGTAINLFAWGFMAVPVLAIWDSLILTSNIMMLKGYMDQRGMDALYALTLMINAVAFLFLLASIINLIVQSKSEASRQV